MKPADLETGATRIRHALESLSLAWEDASQEWSDSTAEAFRADCLEPMAPVVKNALDAIGRLRLLLHEAQRELEG
ncbi:MAG: hypothetical protein ACRCT8_07670 [Lacipirellulaceae bacterium]